MFLGSERQELFMPELGAFRIRETGHGMDDRAFSFLDVVDLTDQADDLGHLEPCLRVMFPSQPLNIEYSPMAVALAGGVIEITEFLQLRVVLFLNSFDLCKGRDVIVRGRQVRILDRGNLSSEAEKFSLLRWQRPCGRVSEFLNPAELARYGKHTYNLAP